MIKQIIIRYCDDCPYYINNSRVSHLTDFCGWPWADLKPFEKNAKKQRVIPSWCPLKDYKKGK